MERERYLIDTNVVIDYFGNKLPPSGMLMMNNILYSGASIFVITKIEVLGFRTSVEEHELFN